MRRSNRKISTVFVDYNQNGRSPLYLFGYRLE